jgi:hypothetical protein
MTDMDEPLRSALADRYIERVLGVGGTPFTMSRGSWSRADSPRSAAQGQRCVLKDTSRRLTTRLGRARPLKAGLADFVAERQ